MENKIEYDIDLPEIPTALKVSEYLAKLPMLTPTTIETDSIKNIVNMCKEATSPMRLERELKIHRAMKKLKAVYTFKNPMSNTIHSPTLHSPTLFSLRFLFVTILL